MIYRGLVCLLLATLAWGQAATKPGTAAQTPPQAQGPASGAAPAATPAAKPPAPADVAPDAAVITLPGVCDNPPADKSMAADCKTVVTRAEFEQILAAVAPNMAPPGRRQLANRYAMGLVMASEAHKMGLDKTPKFEEMMKIMRVQVMSQQLQQALQEKAGDIPDKDIEDYYHQNAAAYDEASLQRIFIPHSKQLAAPKVKLSEAETKKRQEDADAAMKAEAEALQKRAAAGEDFSKLQQEAFTFAGQKAKPPQTSLGKLRRNTMQSDHAFVFDLKPGEVSKLISDPSGYFVYKMGEKDTLTLENVKEEIHNTLRAQRMQQSMQSMQQSVTHLIRRNLAGYSD
ncbi:MAG: peptidyl-prolyl cis-trans isomerase [Acidobacteriia bacterium]|nr:peptidyl-prolyl cis-trans isomerase [Terriglobia bacterium]